jgi:hypothetical protein
MLLMAATAFFAASMGFAAARRRKGDPEMDGPREDGAMDRASRPGASRRATPTSAFDGLPLAVGDVVLGDGEERWLAGALVARESGRVIGALFVAPEGAVQHGVAAFAAPRREVFWLAPAAVDATGEPPATLELRGVVLRRRGRLPVSFERFGTGAPRIEEGIWAEYEAGGRDVALVVTGGGACFAFAGARLEEGDYDRLGAG